MSYDNVNVNSTRLKDESNDYDNTEFEKETRDHPVRQHSKPYLPSSSSPAPRQEYLMDLTKPHLEVRKHALGADGAVWFGTKIDVEGARSEHPSVDDTDVCVFSCLTTLFLSLFHICLFEVRSSRLLTLLHVLGFRLPNRLSPRRTPPADQQHLHLF